MRMFQFSWLAVVICGLVNRAWSQEKFVAPASPRALYSLDAGWRFFKEDKSKIAAAEKPDFDDAAWETISTPHTFNDVDTFRVFSSHSGGDRGSWKGTAWYRKHFRLPATTAGSRILFEFEGMRQAGEIFLNGKAVGLSENGVTGYGVDVTDSIVRDADNILAVHVDNRLNYAERATGQIFQWNTNDFNPVYGGLNRHVKLHVVGGIHQTLPLWDGLKTTGTYIHADNVVLAAQAADITVESQVANLSGDRATVILSAAIVDRDGIVRAKFEADPLDMVTGEKTVIRATAPLRNAHWWSIDDPYLYDVYTTLTVDGKIVDVAKTSTGFRKTDFKGGAGTGGVFINDKFVYLKGFAQRSSNEWAGLGQAYPDWMHALTAKLIRECNGNYIRWMHVAPQKVDVETCDRFGIVQVAPGGDKERAVTGRQWEQRLDVMTATIIAYRNSPSILFWEAGNTVIPPDQMQAMVDLRKKWDPDGGRVMGTRGDSNNPANAAITPVAEFYGVMIGQDRQTEGVTGTGIFRGYSLARRDRAPIIETEDFRDEGGRRFWDDFSPPYFGFKKGPEDTYNWNSETFALASAARYFSYWENRISNADAAHARWSGYASIYFSDSNADGRQQSSEVARASGKVDAVRLPKDIFYTHRVIQSEKPDLHIIGHWSYPADTKKTVYVIANTPAVELFLNGRSLAKNSAPKDGFVFAFPDIAFQHGKLEAIGYTDNKESARHALETAGPAKRITLTPNTGPGGLLADGGDVALFDVEVVDDQGWRCPTDDARIDFTLTGPAIWRGGYNSGKLNSTNNLYLNTECGINRVAIRSTLAPGKIMLTAKRDGLQEARVELESKPCTLKDGLSPR